MGCLGPRAENALPTGTKIDGPPKARDGRSGAAPGRLQPADYASVEGEFQRARTLLKEGDPKIFDRFKLISGAEGMTTGPASDWALTELLNALGATAPRLKPPGATPKDLRAHFDPGDRQKQQPTRDPQGGVATEGASRRPPI